MGLSAIEDIEAADRRPFAVRSGSDCGRRGRGVGRETCAAETEITAAATRQHGRIHFPSLALHQHVLVIVEVPGLGDKDKAVSGVAELILQQRARLAGNQVAADGRITKMADARDGAGLFLFGAKREPSRNGSFRSHNPEWKRSRAAPQDLLDVFPHRPVFSHIIAGQKRRGQGMLVVARRWAQALRACRCR